MAAKALGLEQRMDSGRKQPFGLVLKQTDFALG